MRRFRRGGPPVACALSDGKNFTEVNECPWGYSCELGPKVIGVNKVSMAVTFCLPDMMTYFIEDEDPLLDQIMEGMKERACRVEEQEGSGEAGSGEAGSGEPIISPLAAGDEVIITPGGGNGVVVIPGGNTGDKVEGGNGVSGETDKSEEEKDEDDEDEDIMEKGTCKDADQCSLGPITLSLDGTTFDTYYCWNPEENVDWLRLLSGQRKDCKRDDYDDDDDDYMRRRGRGRRGRGRRGRRPRYWRRW